MKQLTDNHSLDLAVWTLAGVTCGVAVIILLTQAGVHRPIAMGLGLGVSASVQMRSLARFSKARYGEEFRFFPGLLMTIVGGCLIILAIELFERLV